MNVPVVAIVGRPNVGKSALFNRIVGSDAAIVSDEAGTTRDRHFARAQWNGRDFWIVDTGGILEDSRLPMDVEIRRQVDEAISEARRIWDTINGPNLVENILPTRSRATLVLRKDRDHSVRYVRLRKI